MEPSTPTTKRHRRWRTAALIVVVIAILGTTASAVVATDTLGAGHLWERAVAKVDRFLAGPVPDRSAPATVLVTTDPGASDEPDVDPDASPSDVAPSASASPPAGESATPTVVPAPVATARPTPGRRPVDVDVVKNDKAVFAHEIKDTWCASAGVQIVLAILGQGDNSNALPARAPVPGPRVGELQGQPQRRLGAVGHGAGPRRLRRRRLRGPRLHDPPGCPARCGARRSRRRVRRSCSWPGAAPTPGS